MKLDQCDRRNLGRDGGVGHRRAGQAIGVCNFGCPCSATCGLCADQAGSLASRIASLSGPGKTVRFCREARIAVTGFSPLGALSYVELGVPRGPIAAGSAGRDGGGPAVGPLAGSGGAQWGVQRGMAFVPKTSGPSGWRRILRCSISNCRLTRCGRFRPSIAAVASMTPECFARWRSRRFVRFMSDGRRAGGGFKSSGSICA